MSEPIHVVAGVLRDAHGRVLLAQRPPGKHLAGLWEFPGGKCEPGEDPRTALRRELHEELGISIGGSEPLISVPWRYAEKWILLDVYNVDAFVGNPHGRENQALRWAIPDTMLDIPMPDADRPIVAALRLPRKYTITPEPRESFLAEASRALASGSRFIQLRSKRLDDAALRPIALALRELATRHGAIVLLNDRIDLARDLGLGVHLSTAALLETTQRPLPRDRWVGASCHDLPELERAVAIGADFAVLGPVQATASHPERPPLGWDRFAELCREAPIPVFALGGMCEADSARANAAGAQGVAGISAFWPRG